MKKLAAVTFATLAFVSACSSGSSTAKHAATTTVAPGSGASAAPGTTATPGPSDPKLEAAGRAFIEAFIAGDVNAIVPLYTAHCRKTISRANLEKFVAQTRADYKNAKLISITGHVNGTSATVDYVMSAKTLSRTGQRWRIENGTWHNDEC